MEIELMKRAHGVQVVAEGIDQANELLLKEEHGGSGIIQDVSELGGSEADIERKQDAARLENSEVGFEEAMTIEAEERYAFSRLHSGSAQGASEAADAIAKLGIGEPQALAHNRCLARKLLLRVTKKSNRGERDIHRNNYYQAVWPPSTTRTWPVT